MQRTSKWRWGVFAQGVGVGPAARMPDCQRSTGRRKVVAFQHAQVEVGNGRRSQPILRSRCVTRHVWMCGPSLSQPTLARHILFGCQVRHCTPVHVHTVGTFGVESARNFNSISWWGFVPHVARACGRLRPSRRNYRGAPVIFYVVLRDLLSPSRVG